MGINEFFDAIAKVVDRFVEEIAEERAREKEQKIGRGPKVGPKTEKKDVREKGINPDFPKTGMTASPEN